MSLLTGGVYPAQALLFAYLISDLLNPDIHAMRSRANQLSLWWVIIAIILFLAYLVQGWAFGYSSEKMVFSLVKGLAANSRCEGFDVSLSDPLCGKK